MCWLHSQKRKKVKAGCPSHLLQPKCPTNLTWLRSPASTRQSWRRRRQKKKTLCPPKRVSIPFHCLQLALFISCCSSPVTIHPLSKDASWREKSKMKDIAAASAQKNAAFCVESLQHNPWLCSLFFCSHWAGEERRCHTLTWAQEEKLRCHRKKSTFFQLPQYFGSVSLSSD